MGTPVAGGSRAPGNGDDAPEAGPDTNSRGRAAAFLSGVVIALLVVVFAGLRRFEAAVFAQSAVSHTHIFRI